MNKQNKGNGYMKIKATQEVVVTYGFGGGLHTACKKWNHEKAEPEGPLLEIKSEEMETLSRAEYCSYNLPDFYK